MNLPTPRLLALLSPMLGYLAAGNEKIIAQKIQVEVFAKITTGWMGMRIRATFYLCLSL